MEDKKNNNSLIHCTKCRGVLLKNVDTTAMEGKTQFLLRCPHCHKDYSVTIEVGKMPIVTIE